MNEENKSTMRIVYSDDVATMTRKVDGIKLSSKEELCERKKVESSRSLTKLETFELLSNLLESTVRRKNTAKNLPSPIGYDVRNSISAEDESLNNVISNERERKSDKVALVELS